MTPARRVLCSRVAPGWCLRRWLHEDWSSSIDIVALSAEARLELLWVPRGRAPGLEADRPARATSTRMTHLEPAPLQPRSPQ